MEVNKIKTLYIPVLVGCLGGCGIVGLDMIRSQRHWSAWFVWLIELPACFIMGYSLILLLNVVAGWFTDRKRNPPKAGKGAV